MTEGHVCEYYTIYYWLHLPSTLQRPADDQLTLDYIIHTFSELSSKHKKAQYTICCEFNHFDMSLIENAYQLQKLVTFNTRKVMPYLIRLTPTHLSIRKHNLPWFTATTGQVYKTWHQSRWQWYQLCIIFSELGSDLWPRTKICRSREESVQKWVLPVKAN